jgi:hypothetical protein
MRNIKTTAPFGGKNYSYHSRRAGGNRFAVCRVLPFATPEGYVIVAKMFKEKGKQGIS